MALDEIWKVHSIEYMPTATPGDPGNSYISALSSVSMPTQASVNRTIDAGSVFATSGWIDFESIDLTFTSMAAEQAADVLGVNGRCLTTEAVAVYAARYDCSGPVAGSVHRRYTLDRGILYPTSATCDHKGDLQISGMVKAVYDESGSHPVVVADGVPLPTSVQIGDISGRWTMHNEAKTTTNANQVGSKRNINIDYGITVSTQGADSETYDSFASIDSILPVVSVQGIDPVWFDTIGLTVFGTPVTHANTVIPFRKRDGAGGFVTDVTAAHILVSAAGPAYYDQFLSGNATDPASASYRIEAIDDGLGNAPLKVLTGQAVA